MIGIHKTLRGIDMPIDDDLNSFLDEEEDQSKKSDSPFESLVNRIDTLPPLSDSAQKILRLYANDENDDIDIRKLTRLIEQDTLLTANILGLINDPKFGFNNKITSVGQAITLFGTRIMKGFVLSIVMKNQLRPDMGAYGISNEKFNDMGHIQSALVFQWYMGLDMKRAHNLVPLALIMETGKVIFAQEMADSDYGHLFTEELYYAKNMQEVELKYSDTTSYFIGGLLFEHWNFSRRYIDIMKNLDFNEGSDELDQVDLDIIEVIRTAVNIKGFLNKENLDKALALVKEFNLDEAAFMKAALRIKNAYEDSKRAK